MPKKKPEDVVTEANQVALAHGLVAIRADIQKLSASVENQFDAVLERLDALDAAHEEPSTRLNTTELCQRLTDLERRIAELEKRTGST